MAASDHRFLPTALLILVALVFPPLASSSITSAASSSRPDPTQLAAGQRGSYSWSVKATRLAGSRPCVTVAIMHRHGGPFDYDRSRFRECAPASPGLTRSAAPLLAGGTHLGGRTRMTVFGVLAPAGARRVRAMVSDGVEVTPVSTSLVPVGLSANRAVGLRFAVIAIPGSQCLERLVTQGVLGRTLWQGIPSEYDCG